MLIGWIVDDSYCFVCKEDSSFSGWNVFSSLTEDGTNDGDVCLPVSRSNTRISFLSTKNQRCTQYIYNLIGSLPWHLKHNVPQRIDPYLSRDKGPTNSIKRPKAKSNLILRGLSVHPKPDMLFLSTIELNCCPKKTCSNITMIIEILTGPWLKIAPIQCTV